MSHFDPESFLDATTTEASTRRNPIPAGADVVATIGAPKSRSWTSRDQTKSGIAVDVPLTIDLTAYPDLRAQVGVDRVLVQDSIMLDLTEKGDIDYGPGKNSKLRRYREALGMNVPGQPFSIRAFEGRQIKVKIKHRLYEGEAYDEVDSVAKA